MRHRSMAVGLSNLTDYLEQMDARLRHLEEKLDDLKVNSDLESDV